MVISKIYVGFVATYFICICFIVSMLLQVVLILPIVFVYNHIPYIYIQLISVAVVIGVLGRRMLRRSKTELLVENNDIPLEEVNLALWEKLSMLFNRLKIKQAVYVFVRPKQSINAISSGNAHQGYIVIHQGLLEIPENDLLAALYHETYHVIHWPIHIIDNEARFLINELIMKLDKFRIRVSQRFILSRIFLAGEFTNLFILCLMAIQGVLKQFYHFFCVLIDENMADKFSIDMTGRKNIIHLIDRHLNQSSSTKEKYSNLIYVRHLDPQTRRSILEKYHFHKFIKKDWKVYRYVLFLKGIVFLTVALVFVNLIFTYSPVLFQKVFESLGESWLRLFSHNEHRAAIWGVLLMASVYLMWNCYKFFRNYRILNSNSKQRQLLRLLMISLICMSCIVIIIDS